MTVVTGYCRQEKRQTRWVFAGYATTDGGENHVRPRAYTQRCESCGLTILTLGAPLAGHVRDAEGLCRVVFDEWTRRNLGRATGANGGIRVGLRDPDNILGSLYEYVWHLYGTWQPSGLPFVSYATGLLRRRINRFISRDTGLNQRNPDPAAPQRADAYSVSCSYDQLAATDGGVGLYWALAPGQMDDPGDRVQAAAWLEAVRDRGAARDLDPADGAAAE